MVKISPRKPRNCKPLLTRCFRLTLKYSRSNTTHVPKLIHPIVLLNGQKSSLLNENLWFFRNFFPLEMKQESFLVWKEKEKGRFIAVLMNKLENYRSQIGLRTEVRLHKNGNQFKSWNRLIEYVLENYWSMIESWKVSWRM